MLLRIQGHQEPWWQLYRSVSDSMMWRMRQSLVLAHRWLGLVMAGFLLLAAITGSLLVWNEELDAAINPHLFHVSESEEDALDPLVLRTSVLAHYPHAQMPYVPLERASGDSVRFRLQAATDETTGKSFALENDEIFVHPWSGEILGERKWGDLRQGVTNLMPFIYRLHYSLALDVVGTYVLGIIALLWTIDCFIGAFLTMPLKAGDVKKVYTSRSKSWLSRWMPAWRIRWSSGAYKLNFDFHRAGGLWMWAALFVLAWSSVAFNLPEVYSPVMRTLFTHQGNSEARTVRASSLEEDRLSWVDARDVGRRHMDDYAHKAGFVILAEGAIAYQPRQAVYRYDVRSSLDVRDHGSKTRVFFDAYSGALIRTAQPTGAYAEDTIRMWLTSLHMAALWGWPFRVFVCIMGLVVGMLCGTGIVVWNKKRKARKIGLTRKQELEQSNMRPRNSSCTEN